MGDIGPTQQRYDVLPVDEPGRAPTREPVTVEREPQDVPARPSR